MSKHVFSILEEAAAKWNDRPAIIEHGKNISFAELHESALLLCDKLESAVDLRGKGIGFVCGNRCSFVFGLFACAKAGAIAMPVLSGTQGSEVEHLFQEASINVLLAEKGNRFSFSGGAEKIDLSEEFDLYIFSQIKSQNIDAVFPGAAFIRPSSGTTGDSKGVVISHRAVFERSAAANTGLMLNENDVMLWVLPMAFHFVVSVLLYIRYGVCMIISDHFTAESIILNANRFHATHLYASPLHYRLLAAEKSTGKFETLKKAISTSALLEPVVSQAFFDKYDIPVSQAYGIIEIGLPFINNERENKRSESIGKALPGYTAAILDAYGKALSLGLQGAFAIKGPGMFSGYLWPVIALDEVLAESWFLTGDIAEMDRDGFVYIKGRSKSMINVSGNKVFPEEVEAILKLHPDVEDCRVYGGKHPVTGELVEAEIVLKRDSEKDIEKIISHCREHLLSYKVPQRIFFVDEIRKTKTGKIKRS
ncbi:MAG: class I adenylate-forming enzyme family protein [Bacteroidetes bacterium]|nr:class I adenylate-forming enzyme family protein [Bacteroidota bacterium]